jgi:hypothetical protein
MPGTLVITTLSDGTNSTSATNPIQGSAKAWVNFNGTNGSIRASYNVSSVTQIAGATYQVNFTNAFADVNYSVNASCSVETTGDFSMICNIGSTASSNLPTTSSVRVVQRAYNFSGVDGYQSSYVYVSVFR